MSNKKIAIIIPTYNEKESIGLLISKVHSVMKRSRFDYKITIVDDNSTDGTLDVIDKHKNKVKIKLIKRKQKLGLGSACILGFGEALKNGDDFIFQMDADLSHDPKYIPNFIEKINEGYDVVIGSRLVKDGGVVGWSFTRKLISWGGNFIGRFIAGINVSDLTSGYRVYKRKVLESIDLDEIKSRSYDFQLEMLSKVLSKGFKVGTMPIIFYDRKYGKSKLTKSDQLRFLLAALRIRFAK